MALSYPQAPARRLVVVLDVALALWVVGWIFMALFMAREVRGTARLPATVIEAGRALKETSRQLGTLEELPFVGERVADVRPRVEAAADVAIASGRESRESVKRLSVLLGVAIAVAPTAPMIVLYVPLRLLRVREARAIRRALAEHGPTPAFLEFLARRATQRLPYHALMEVSENPWRDLEQGRYARLAAAELRRLGIRRVPRARSTSAPRPVVTREGRS